MKPQFRRISFKCAAVLITAVAAFTVFGPSGTRVKARPAAKLSDIQVLPELERQMLDMINEERRVRRLKPLSADPALTRVAREHSLDMIRRNYFAHNTLDGRSPFDRLLAAGIRFRIAGENLATARTLEFAHVLLMRSKGHRENILQSEFGRVGIGVIGQPDGLMISQEFRD